MFLLDARLSLFEINQNFDFGVTIADGYSYLGYLLRLLKYLNYTKYYMMLPGHCRYIVAKVQATVTWFDREQIFTGLFTRLDYIFAFT